MAKKSKRSKRSNNKLWGWVLVVGAVALYVGIVWWPGESNTADSGGKGLGANWAEGSTDLAQGEKLYGQFCAQCHGAQAQGQDPAQKMGGRLADGKYLAPALNGSGHAWHHAPKLLHRIVKEGSPAPDSPMIGFRDRMTDEEIGAVFGYLHSIWPAKIREQYAKMHNIQ